MWIIARIEEGRTNVSHVVNGVIFGIRAVDVDVVVRRRSMLTQNYFLNLTRGFAVTLKNEFSVVLLVGLVCGYLKWNNRGKPHVKT